MKPILVGWVERSDRTLVRSDRETHRRAGEVDGFRKGSTHPTSFVSFDQNFGISRLASEQARLGELAQRSGEGKRRGGEFVRRGVFHGSRNLSPLPVF